MSKLSQIFIKNFFGKIFALFNNDHIWSASLPHANKENIKNLRRCETYPDFNNTDLKTWPRIFKLPFQVIRETKIQAFQYKILHRIISCNKWLFNIKIKTSEV